VKTQKIDSAQRLVNAEGRGNNEERGDVRGVVGERVGERGGWSRKGFAFTGD
jgi:hypothetical protein